MGLVLGVDICDDYSQISMFDPIANDAISVSIHGTGSSDRIPTVICKKKGENEWLIGEEAYRAALLGGGSVVDSLVRLVTKSSTATIEGVKYSADELLGNYIKKVIGIAKRNTSIDDVDSIVFTVQEPEPKLNDAIIKATDLCGISREIVHIYSHTECLTYYILSQKSEIWTNQVSVFDLRENGLYYYEMRVIRGRKPFVAQSTKEKLPESFSIDVLDSSSGARLGDSILSSCAKRLLDGKLISTVILTGRGFNMTDWCPDFLKVICNRKKVFQATQLFSQGAAFSASELIKDKSEYPFLMLCEGRIPSTITMQGIVDGKKEQIVLAEAGTSWYEASSSAMFIVDDTDEIEIQVSSMLSNKQTKKYISLAELPARKNKTTRVELITSFVSENQMIIRVVDRGFGDLFPATDKVIREDFLI